MSALVTVLGRSAEAIAVPFSSSVPLPVAGRVTIFTLDSVSSVSVSAKLNSLAANVWSVSSLVVTVLSVAVGAALVTGRLVVPRIWKRRRPLELFQEVSVMAFL